MGKKNIDAAEVINKDQMTLLYEEVDRYNSPEAKKKRKSGRIWNYIVDSVFIVLLVIISYLIVIINITKENNQVPFLFNHSLQYVQTGSMDPTLPVGSIIFCRKYDPKVDTIRVGYHGTSLEGDIITFYDASRTIVTHRAVQKFTSSTGILCFETKGDNNSSIDPNPIPYTDVISVFIAKVV